MAKSTTSAGRSVPSWLRADRLLTTALFFVLSQPADAFRNVEVGDPVPPLVVEDMAGARAEPLQTGKVTVLVFWSPAQPGTETVLEDLAKLVTGFDAARVSVVAIAAGGSDVASTRQRVLAQGIQFPVFIDGGERMREQYGIVVFPSTAVLSADKRLQYYQPGRPHDYRDRIEGKVKRLLDGVTSRAGADALEAGSAESAEEAARRHLREAARLRDSNQARDAIDELQQAIDLNPELKDARLQLGYLLLDHGDPKQALQEFQTVREQFAHSPSADVGIGIAHLRLGDTEMGIQLLERAVALNPDPVRGYAELGNAYEAAGDLDKALAHYKRAISKLLAGRH